VTVTKTISHALIPAIVTGVILLAPAGYGQPRTPKEGIPCRAAHELGNLGEMAARHAASAGTDSLRAPARGESADNALLLREIGKGPGERTTALFEWKKLAQLEGVPGNNIPPEMNDDQGRPYVPVVWLFVACPLCGSARCAPVRYVSYNRIVECRECGMRYTNPQTVEKPNDYYDAWGYDLRNLRLPDIVSSKESMRALQTVDFVMRYLNEHAARKLNGAFLDVGSAFGFTLYHLNKKYGWPRERLTGVELSPAAAGVGARGLGINNRGRTLEEQRFKNGEFDVILLSETIEHLTAPRETMNEIRRVLKPDGIVIFTAIPNNAGVLARAAAGRNPSLISFCHYSHFTPSTIERFLKKTGFEIVYRMGTIRPRSPQGGWRRDLQYVAGNVLGLDTGNETACLGRLRSLLAPTLVALGIQVREEDFRDRGSFELFWNSVVSPSFEWGDEMAVVARPTRRVGTALIGESNI